MKLAVAIVALILGSAAGAHAQPWSRHAPLCRTVYPGDQPHLNLWGVLWVHRPNATTVICPVPDTSDRPDSQITEVQVHITRNNLGNSFSVRACRTARTQLGYECGPPVASSTQSSVITLDPRPIWEPTDFGYLEVTIGPGDPADGVEGYAFVY
jgi:hypothetical protein